MCLDSEELLANLQAAEAAVEPPRSRTLLKTREGENNVLSLKPLAYPPPRESGCRYLYAHLVVVSVAGRADE